MNGTANIPTDGTTPTSMAYAVAELVDAGPAFAKIAEGLMELVRDTDPQRTSFVLVSLAGLCDGSDVLSLLTQVIRYLGDPATNAGLRSLPAESAAEIRRLTRDWAEYTEAFTPRQTLAEAAWTADPDSVAD